MFLISYATAQSATYYWAEDKYESCLDPLNLHSQALNCRFPQGTGLASRIRRHFLSCIRTARANISLRGVKLPAVLLRKMAAPC